MASNILSQRNRNSVVGTVGPRWKGLCNTGGIAALTMFALMIIQIVVFAVWPPPGTAEGYFKLFQNNWFLGLLSLDLLYIVDSVLLILIYLALYVVLRKASQSAMLIALVLGIAGIAAYFASNFVRVLIRPFGLFGKGLYVLLPPDHPVQSLQRVACFSQFTSLQPFLQ